jgi:hypothetical protein
MIFEVPFRYAISGQKEGNAISSSARRWEVARVEVHAVSADEAPMVMAWVERDVMRRWMGAADKADPIIAEDGTQHVRLFDGRYWTPMLGAAITGDGNLRASADDLYRAILGGTAVGGFAVPPEYSPTRAMGDGSDPYAGYVTVRSSDREQELARIARSFEDLLVVDGQLYQLAAEPKIVVRMTTFELQRVGSGTKSVYMGHVIRIVADRDFQLDTSSALFPIDRFSEAMSYCRRRNGHVIRKEDFNSFNERREPTIQFPDHVERPDSSLALLETYATAFVNSFEKIPPREVSTDHIRRYADIRDGLQSLPSEEGVAMMEAAATSLLSDHDLDSGHGGAWPNCFVFLRGMVDTAARRPVELEIEFTQRGPTHGIR